MLLAAIACQNIITLESNHSVHVLAEIMIFLLNVGLKIDLHI